MTKSERRKARKAARASGRRLTNDLAVDDRDASPIEFTESACGYDARHRWAKRYDALNGAPEGDWDR